LLLSVVENLNGLIRWSRQSSLRLGRNLGYRGTLKWIGEGWSDVNDIPTRAAARGCPTGNIPMAGRIASAAMEEAGLRTHHRRSRIGKNFPDQHLQQTLLDTRRVNGGLGR